MTDGDWQNATIVKIIEQTPRIKSYFFRLPQPFVHRAGQHVDLRLTGQDGYRAMRSYSIASAPDATGIVEVAIERLDDGEVSSFFDEVAAVGDEIELRGPLGGHFVWSPSDGGPLLLIGGGSGIVPLMAMIRQWQAERSEVRVMLLLSSRSASEALYIGELMEIDASASGFDLRLALTRETPQRAVDSGRRIDAAMIGDLLGLLGGVPKYVFICGSNGFANTAADSVVSAGVAASNVRTERYGG